MHLDEDVECPRCGEQTSVGIDADEDGSLDIECVGCGATLGISYSVSMQIDDVDISDVPAADFSCPECGNSMSMDDVDEESGRQEIKCDGCDAVLEVTWSKWGQDIEVEVIEGGGDDDDDDEGEDGDVEEGGDDGEEEDEEW